MSRQTHSAKDHYRLALQQYKKGEFLETVKSIDKAISFGYRDIVVYDVKAAALSKLTKDDEVVWRDQAMDVIQHMCKQWGTKDWRPWHRKAEYLRSRKLYVHALTAIDKALELVDTKNREFVVSKQAAIKGEREAARIEQDRRLATASEAERKAIMEARRAEAKSTKDFTQLISPDVLLLITDHLLLDNPSIGCRLSAVCRRWRDVLHERPAVWSTLVLGKTRPLQKATKFLERNKGGVWNLKLLPSFDSWKLDLAGVISDHVDQLKSFEFCDRPVDLLDELYGRFTSLERLTQISPSNRLVETARTARPDRGLGLDGSHPTLRSLRIDCSEMINFGLADGSLSQLREVTLRRCAFLHDKGPLEIFYQTSPLIERIDLRDSLAHRVIIDHSTNIPLPDPSFAEEDGGQARVMRSLHEYIEPSPALLRFEAISAPNLVHLDMSSLSALDKSLGPYPVIIDQLKAAGLVNALPNLQSLDIGGHTLGLSRDDLESLVEVLSGMFSLRFLNVSFTFIDDQDAMLKALTWRNSARDEMEDGPSTDLLPNLEALSIAGLDVTSIALRDLVLSRLPQARQPMRSQRQSQPTSSRSAFKPSSTSAAPSLVMRPESSAENRATGSSLTPSQPIRRVSSSQTQRRACLKWLCVDHCTSIDTQLPVYLATKLPFVSHSLRERKVLDRIKGKGRYGWDLDYYHSCAYDDVDRCTVERVEGTTDSWRLVHHCGLEDAPYEVQPEVDNIWESQWDPASTPSGSGREPDVTTGWTKLEKSAVDSAHARESVVHGVKRATSVASGLESGMQRGGPSKARKGKDRMKISIGPDGSLTGF